MTRYEVERGFNTKQLWVYDTETGYYIDPPVSILKEIDSRFGRKRDPEAIEWLEKFIENTNPEWLKDEDFYYDAEETEI